MDLLGVDSVILLSNFVSTVKILSSVNRICFHFSDAYRLIKPRLLINLFLIWRIASKCCLPHFNGLSVRSYRTALRMVLRETSIYRASFLWFRQRFLWIRSFRALKNLGVLFDLGRPLHFLSRVLPVSVYSFMVRWISTRLIPVFFSTLKISHVFFPWKKWWIIATRFVWRSDISISFMIGKIKLSFLLDNRMEINKK